ncbi:MAG: hypothetical protein JWP93_719 [Polaromonas sp.]|jgi:hypothetical protein|nr:hypothetical protein [Polaromonas sp.]
MKKSTRFSPEVHKSAVRMVVHHGEYLLCKPPWSPLRNKSAAFPEPPMNGCPSMKSTQVSARDSPRMIHAGCLTSIPAQAVQRPGKHKKNPWWLCGQDAQTHRAGRLRMPASQPGCRPSARELPVPVAMSSAPAPIGVGAGKFKQGTSPSRVHALCRLGVEAAEAKRNCQARIASIASRQWPGQPRKALHHDSFVQPQPRQP